MGNKKHNLLLISSVLLYAASFLPGLSILLLLFLVPLIAVLDEIHRKVSLYWLSAFYLTLVLGGIVGLLFNDQSFDVGLILYPAGLTISIAFAIYVSNILKGSIKTTALISFWLGYNYLILKIMPEWSVHYVFNNLYNDSLLWTSATGFLGVAFWALISNIILSKRLVLSSSKLIDKPLLLVFNLLLISIPFWIGNLISIANEPIDQTGMFFLYSQGEASEDYLLRGEWIARTCAWLAVLLSTYGIVKRKTVK